MCMDLEDQECFDDFFFLLISKLMVINSFIKDGNRTCNAYGGERTPFSPLLNDQGWNILLGQRIFTPGFEF